MRLVRILLLGWLGAVAADGALRVLGGLLELATGRDLVRLLLVPVELVAVVGAAAAWLVVAVAPRVPLRVVLPPMLVAAWLALGGLPVSVLFFGGPGMNLSLGAALLASVALAEALARTAGHGRWLLRAEPLGDALDPTWTRALGWIGGWALLGPLGVTAYAVGGAAWTLSWGTAGFLQLTTEGVSAAHKIYTRDGDTVDLVAMVHVGEAHAYDELFRTIPPEGTLVLAEGVSDREQRLTVDRDAYGQTASALGLSAQRPIDEIAALEVRRADVDVSSFDPVTVELLDTVFDLYASPDDPGPALAAYLAFWQRHRADSDAVLHQLWADLVLARNAHLLAELEAARPTRDRLVIPWGALHLPGIEAELEAAGWEHQDTRRVTLIRWSTLFG